LLIKRVDAEFPKSCNTGISSRYQGTESEETEQRDRAFVACSRRGDLVLDPLGGSGSTLIAAERTGRKARVLELDPHYCDVIVRRWQVDLASPIP
jgi:hypothetical protein